MTWAILAPIIIQIVARFLGKRFGLLVARMLPKDGEIKAMDAPPSLKLLIKDALLAAADKIKMPGLSALVKLVVSKLDGIIIDAIWDEMFRQKLVAQSSTAFGGTVKTLGGDTDSDLLADAVMELLPPEPAAPAGVSDVQEGTPAVA